MPEKHVPNVDEVSAGSPQKDGRLQDIEIRLLDAGAKSKENLNREADQRFSLRRLAIFVAVLLIVGMGAILWHGTHRIFSPQYFDVPAPYVVAIFVAPILSMTTLAIGILVAAFRGFSARDGEGLAGMATDSAKAPLLGD